MLEVDLQSAKEMTGISYLPDQARWANGIVVKYMIEISLDGIRWEEAARGEFANIQNNPVEQQVIFRQTLKDATSVSMPCQQWMVKRAWG